MQVVVWKYKGLNYTEVQGTKVTRFGCNKVVVTERLTTKCLLISTNSKKII